MAFLVTGSCTLYMTANQRYRYYLLNSYNTSLLT